MINPRMRSWLAVLCFIIPWELWGIWQFLHERTHWRDIPRDFGADFLLLLWPIVGSFQLILAIFMRWLFFRNWKMGRPLWALLAGCASVGAFLLLAVSCKNEYIGMLAPTVFATILPCWQAGKELVKSPALKQTVHEAENGAAE